MQFQVPQFIETEDKVVGPLSLRQFVYVGIGALLSALLYFVVQTWLWAIISVFLVGGAIAIAFVKVEGRPLANVIMAAASFYWSPQIYIWQPPQQHFKTAARPKEEEAGLMASLQKIAEGQALHKHWESLQTGEKMSGTQFAQKKMNERYGIFRNNAGDKAAARRVDYR